MYLVKLFENPVPTDGTAVPLFDGGAQYSHGGDIDRQLKELLKLVVSVVCRDSSRRYSVQIWDEANQAWYVPSSRTHMEPGRDGLIPVESVVMVGSLRL